MLRKHSFRLKGLRKRWEVNRVHRVMKMVEERLLCRSPESLVSLGLCVHLTPHAHGLGRGWSILVIGFPSSGLLQGPNALSTTSVPREGPN